MAFQASVEKWRALASQYAADAPTDFMLDWMSKESGGNRCNLTTSAGFNEVGLFQLDAGNAAMAGVDLGTLRNGCTGQTDTSGTDDDQTLAVSSGVDYVKALKALTHQRLTNAGADWDESTADFWSIVRLQHAAGTGAMANWLAAATANLGRGPANWSEFVSASGAQGNHWIDVSAENGSWGAGFSPTFLDTILGINSSWLIAAGFAGLFIGAWLTTKIGSHAGIEARGNAAHARKRRR